MIQATPFDLVLLTAAADEQVQDLEEHYDRIRTHFTERRDRIHDTNQRLAENPTLAGCKLCMPLTDALLWQLCETPSWLQVRGRSKLYMLKTIVLAFLLNSHDDTRSVFRLDSVAIEHTYRLVGSQPFFPSSLAPKLCDNWVEAVGICAFERGVMQSQVAPMPIHAVWVISVERPSCSQELKIARTYILESEGTSEDCALPMLTQSDFWVWEFLVRESLWQDRRFPFNGPFGYCPPQGWQPGEGLTQTRYQGQHGYRDALGGLWQWEGGRARISSPLGGHWNVQLLDGHAVQSWVRRLEEAYEQPVRLRADYLNIEVDGRIVDQTFDLGQNRR